MMLTVGEAKRTGSDAEQLDYAADQTGYLSFNAADYIALHWSI